MIHEEICTYEVCKLAKEKGFNEYEACNHIYEDDEQWHTLTTYTNAKGIDWSKDKFAVAPSQSLLQRWLREEKGVVIDVVLDWQYNIEAEEIRYQYRIGSKHRMTIGGIKTRGISCDRYFATYELALEDALKYTLENLV